MIESQKSFQFNSQSEGFRLSQFGTGFEANNVIRSWIVCGTNSDRPKETFKLSSQVEYIECSQDNSGGDFEEANSVADDSKVQDMQNMTYVGEEDQTKAARDFRKVDHANPKDVLRFTTSCVPSIPHISMLTAIGTYDNQDWWSGYFVQGPRRIEVSVVGVTAERLASYENAAKVSNNLRHIVGVQQIVHIATTNRGTFYCFDKVSYDMKAFLNTLQSNQSNDINSTLQDLFQQLLRAFDKVHSRGYGKLLHLCFINSLLTNFFLSSRFNGTLQHWIFVDIQWVYNL